MSPSSLPEKNRPVVLVLGGGNALGSYLAGAYGHLQQRDVEPRWIVGASIGAITGAIIAGNAPEERVPRLREFWERATIHSGFALGRDSSMRHAYNETHTALALLLGRPGLFGHRFPGVLSMLPWMPSDVALYDHRPLRETLERLIDFARLNRGGIRFTAVCVDVETGDEILFDTEREEIGPDHLLATSAILPVFPPVEIGGRLLCDPGFVNNMPVDVALAVPPDEDTLCIAIELFSLKASRPASLDVSAERANDLIFASSSRRSIRALQREYGLRERIEPDGPFVTLLHLAYQSGSDERAGKTFDYSPASLRDRWAAGSRDMEHALAQLADPGREAKRFEVVRLDPHRAAASAETGARTSA
ncbi:patatin-like phospholipase family protein [Microvirga makkahensis]|uniref:Patatin-like phospholipase family protein n=1 Tax=Microvirga makkahensis TaxID=1128670 RepID=A0A7X3MRP8_9HYPH|nr:patatin-like phospholipase family protein [Microvirga makkahensis]MXQ11977.1 patatin-like phospholipase family protein [Microvirga makkahensis]